MNKAQKIVVVIGLLVIVGLSLYPHKTSSGGRESEGLWPLTTTSKWTPSGYVKLSVDYGTLILSWTIAALAACACVLMIGAFTKQHDMPHKNQGSIATLVLLVFIGAVGVLAALGYQKIIRLEREVAQLSASCSNELDSVQDALEEQRQAIQTESDEIEKLQEDRATIAEDLTSLSHHLWMKTGDAMLLALTSGSSNLH